MQRGDDIRVSVTTEGDVVSVSVEGSLDYYTAPLLRDEIERVTGGPATVIEVRLGAINVIDSSGLSVLIYAYKLARARGKELALRGEAGTVARLLHRTSLDRVIPLQPPRPPAAGTLTDSAASA